MQCPSCSEPVRPGTTVCTSCWTDLQPAPVGVGAAATGNVTVPDGPPAPAAAPPAPPVLPIPPPPAGGAAPHERGWSTPTEVWRQGPQGAGPTAGTGGTAGTAGTNGKAVASLVLGILWLGGLGAVLAIGLGLVARREIRRSGGRQGGQGLAVAGVVLGVLGVAVPLALAAILLPAFMNRDQIVPEVALGAGLRMAMTEQEVALADQGTYLAELPALAAPPGVTVRVVRGDAQGYCMEAMSADVPTVAHVTEGSQDPQDGPCPG